MNIQVHPVANHNSWRTNKN